jgi:hypothetical protein
MLGPTGTWFMNPEEFEIQHPRLLRAGLWEFTHKDGHAEEIRLVEREDPMTYRMYLAPVTDMPTVEIEEMLVVGRFTRYLGP